METGSQQAGTTYGSNIPRDINGNCCSLGSGNYHIDVCSTPKEMNI